MRAAATMRVALMTHNTSHAAQEPRHDARAPQDEAEAATAVSKPPVAKNLSGESIRCEGTARPPSTGPRAQEIECDSSTRMTAMQPHGSAPCTPETTLTRGQSSSSQGLKSGNTLTQVKENVVAFRVDVV